MLVPLRRLVLRARHVRSRADELVDVYDRLRSAGGAFGDEERELATELRALKIRVSAMLADVSSCGRCANGKPAPRGVFSGGDCCSSITAELFDDDELAALAAGGTRAGDLRAPTAAHAGCAFRGAMGCTLTAGDRPVRCVRYTCGTLRREIHARGDLAVIEELLAELRAMMERFLALRSARLDDELLGPD